MRSVSLSSSTLVAWLLVVQGCSSADPETTPAPDGGADVATDAGADGVSDTGGVTADVVCQRQAAAMCKKLLECASRIYLNYPGDAACIAASKADCLSGIGGSTTWTVDKQSACTDAYVAAGCSAVFEGVPACERPPGTKVAGTACVDSAECAAGLNCVVPAKATTVCGVCTKIAQEGDDCSGDVLCADGLRCDGTCYVPAKLGEGCYKGKLCAFPLTCGSTGDPCHAPKRSGESCGPAVDDCDQYNGLGCNPGTHKCEPVVTAASAGDSCGFDSTSGQTTVCIHGLRCSGTDKKTAHCVARLPEGATCALTAGSDPCGVGLSCVGTCKRRADVVCK